MDDYKHVNRIIKAYTPQEGCTCPLKVELDGGIQAIHKYPGNPQGVLAVFNDYFASRVAQMAKLSIPEIGIASLDEETDVSVEGLQLELYKGNGFYSTYIPQTAPASKRIIARSTNLAETCRMILVDAIVFNMDRHAGNVLVNYQKDDCRMYPIDYTHAFGGPDWTTETLQIGDSGSPVFWRENADFYQMLRNAGANISQEIIDGEILGFRSSITDTSLDTIIAELPADWVQKIGNDNIVHAKRYVLQRIDDLENIVSMIKREGGIG